MVYWMSKVSWTGVTDTIWVTDTSFRDEDITVVNGFGGLGITYFLSPQSPSLFVSVGVGLSGWAYPFENRDYWSGLGVAGSIGWEFRPTWILEALSACGLPKGSQCKFLAVIPLSMINLVWSKEEFQRKRSCFGEESWKPSTPIMQVSVSPTPLDPYITMWLIPALGTVGDPDTLLLH